jgi:gliding motility-associated-like protein
MAYRNTTFNFMKLLLPVFLLLSNLALSQVNLNNGLIAHYPFTGNANDVSGNNINGVVSNATLTSDRTGNANSAYYFNGTNAYILLPYSNLYNFAPQDSFSISVWVLPDAGYTWPAQAVVVKAPANPDFTLSLWNYGTYIFNYRAMSGYAYNNITNGTTTLTPNACWYNLVSTYKNGVWRLYVNGILESENTTQTRFILQDGSSRIAFGKKGESFGDWYKGKMDEVRIYNRVLNQEEINTIVGTCQIPCNNWLRTTTPGDAVKIGDLDISGNQLTVEATFNRVAPYTGNYLYGGDIVSKHDQPNDCNYLLRVNNAEITTTNGFFQTPPVCEIELNKTYHVAMTYNGSTLRFYRNGFLLSEMPASGNLVLNNWLTTIGDYAPGTAGTPENMNGYINEVRIWNVARSQVDIRSYMNTSLPNPTTQTGLRAYYTFDNLLNKQGNAAWNGTLIGNASINNTNPSCTVSTDSCVVLCSPKNDFSFTQNSCNPFEFTFSTNSNTYQSIAWDFGDNTTATAGSTVTHTYAATGNYTVTMIQQYGNCADTVQKTFSIIIQNDPQAIITQDTTICFGTSKQLNAAPALSYCWSPVANLNDPSAQNPVTSTPGTTTYYLTSQKKGTNLIVNGNFSAGNSGFTSQYTYNAASGINPGVYTVSNNPVAWHPQMPACTDHTGTAGNGNMMIVNGAQTANVRVWTQTVTVQPNTNYAFETWVQHMTSSNPAQLQFSINGVLIGPVFTANNTACIWNRFYSSWNSGNSTSATIAIVNQNQVFTGNDFALDDISFAPIIIARDSITITVDTPAISVSNDTTVCAGTAVQLMASGGNNYTWSPALHLSNVNLANPVATPTNTTKYFVTGTNVAGCTATDSITVTINPLPIVSISNDTLICSSSSVQLVASGGISYSWLPTATLSNSSIANPVATPAGSTTYSVTVTDNNNCSNSDSVSVSVRPPDSFTISPSASVCSADSVQLTVTGGDVYAWSPAAYLSNAAIANPMASPNTTMDFTVTVTDTLCSYSETLSATVTVLPLPTLSLTKSNDIDCSNNSSRLSVSGAAQYLWSPGSTLNSSVSSNPLATPVETTTYIVSGTDFNGCANTDSITVLVNNTNKGGYLMPNAFTPNNDGVNDCYGISSWGIILELEFSIYNRWGERVFFTTEPGKCWDGTYKGVKQDPGMFTYSIKAKTSCESMVIRKGVFSLIR